METQTIDNKEQIEVLTSRIQLLEQEIELMHSIIGDLIGVAESIDTEIRRFYIDQSTYNNFDKVEKLITNNNAGGI